MRKSLCVCFFSPSASTVGLCHWPPGVCSIRRMAVMIAACMFGSFMVTTHSTPSRMSGGCLHIALELLGRIGSQPTAVVREPLWGGEVLQGDDGRHVPVRSSKFVTSRVWTAWTPHNRPSRRAVVSDAVIAITGTAGRSRAMRRAVDPELV